MHRFFVPPEACHAQEIELPESEAHHALQVLRVRAQERVAVLNGAGEELLCEVTAAGRTGVRLRVVQRNTLRPLPCQVTLLQAVPKSKAMDLIVQKAVELGASRVVPLLSDRTVPQLDEDGGAQKAAKWRTAAVEAAKQSGAGWLPTIEAPATVSACLARNERHDLSLVASLQPEARHPREFFEAFYAEKGHSPRSLAVWVGPEGDFTPSEINAIRGSGALPITLGPLVLRCETAALYCLSILSYEATAPGR